MLGLALEVIRKYGGRGEPWEPQQGGGITLESKVGPCSRDPVTGPESACLFPFCPKLQEHATLYVSKQWLCRGGSLEEGSLLAFPCLGFKGKAPKFKAFIDFHCKDYEASPTAQQWERDTD